MTPLEIDHVFCFVDREFDDSAALAGLRAFGLTVEFGRVHAGQGTANRLVLFPDRYLELLWLADREEAERNPLRLDRRASGPNPFGVCLRGRLDPQVRAAHFWDYSLPGTALESIAIAKLSDDLGLPLLFVFDTDLDTRPGSLSYPRHLFEHPGGFTRIERIELRAPVDLAAALGPLRALLPDDLELGASERPHMRVHLRGPAGEPSRRFDLSESLGILGPCPSAA